LCLPIISYALQRLLQIRDHIRRIFSSHAQPYQLRRDIGQPPRLFALLLMTIRQGIPVFGGLTARYVEAGVLAAVVADADRLPAQLQAALAELARGQVPAPAYPAASRVVVNPTVAHSLAVPAAALERSRSVSLQAVDP
jgi:hypothetical protein